MNILPESVLDKMHPLRIKRLRHSVLAHINKRERNGEYCCECKCEWIVDPNHSYPKEERDRDYAYRDLVNAYYDKHVANMLIN